MLVHLLRRLHGLRFRFLNYRIDYIGLSSELDLSLEKAVDFFDLVIGRVLSDNRLAARGQLVDYRDVKIPIDRQRERAGNGCRRHHQHVWMLALPRQLESLHDAEAVLLIDDRQAQAAEL